MQYTRKTSWVAKKLIASQGWRQNELTMTGCRGIRSYAARNRPIVIGQISPTASIRVGVVFLPQKDSLSKDNAEQTGWICREKSSI